MLGMERQVISPIHYLHIELHKAAGDFYGEGPYAISSTKNFRREPVVAQFRSSMIRLAKVKSRELRPIENLQAQRFVNDKVQLMTYKIQNRPRDGRISLVCKHGISIISTTQSLHLHNIWTSYAQAIDCVASQFALWPVPNLLRGEGRGRMRVRASLAL